VVLPQLEYPNAFDTYLATVSQGVDPGIDLGWLSSDRVTTKADPGDANYGGWRDKSTDALLAAGAASLTEAKRRSAYTDLQARLSDQVPVWPLAYEAAYGAVSKDLLGPDGRSSIRRSRTMSATCSTGVWPGPIGRRVIEPRRSAIGVGRTGRSAFLDSRRRPGPIMRQPFRAPRGRRLRACADVARVSWTRGDDRPPSRRIDVRTQEDGSPWVYGLDGAWR
jgi:hypothetical protein